jgi:hypothetical protein
MREFHVAFQHAAQVTVLLQRICPNVPVFTFRKEIAYSNTPRAKCLPAFRNNDLSEIVVSIALGIVV